MKTLPIPLFLSLLICFSACVSGKKYREEVDVRRDFEERYLQYQGETERLGRYTSELEGRLANLQDEYSRAETRRQELEAEVTTLRAQVEAYENQSTAQQQEQSAKADELARAEAELKAQRERVDAIYDAVGSRDVQLMQILSAIDRHFEGNQPENLTFERKEGAVMVTIPNDQLFRSGQTRVKTDGKKMLEEILPLLRVTPGLRYVIRVHDDGNKDDLTTSSLRAVALAKLFVDNEFLANRIQTVGMGDAYALYDNQDELGRRLNRRTEIIIRGDETDLNKLLQMSGG